MTYVSADGKAYHAEVVEVVGAGPSRYKRLTLSVTEASEPLVDVPNIRDADVSTGTGYWTTDRSPDPPKAKPKAAKRTKPKQDDEPKD